MKERGRSILADSKFPEGIFHFSLKIFPEKGGRKMFSKIRRWHVILAAVLVVILAALEMLSKLPVREFVEIFYLIGGAVVAVAAVLALRQIDLFQKDSLQRAKREAALATVQLCERYACSLLPQMSAILSSCRALKIPLYDPDLGPNPAEAEKWLAIWKAKKDEDIADKVYDAANHLEAMAMYFVHGIADEQIAYGPIGPSYLTTFTILWPIIYLSRRDDPNLYRNSMELFRIWLLRSTNPQVQKEAAKMNKMAKAAAALVNGGGPRPIGTV